MRNNCPNCRWGGTKDFNHLCVFHYNMLEDGVKLKIFGGVFPSINSALMRSLRRILTMSRRCL